MAPKRAGSTAAYAGNAAKSIRPADARPLHVFFVSEQDKEIEKAREHLAAVDPTLKSFTHISIAGKFRSFDGFSLEDALGKVPAGDRSAVIFYRPGVDGGEKVGNAAMLTAIAQCKQLGAGVMVIEDPDLFPRAAQAQLTGGAVFLSRKNAYMTQHISPALWKSLQPAPTMAVAI